jgi:hypothetical protein
LYRTLFPPVTLEWGSRVTGKQRPSVLFLRRARNAPSRLMEIRGDGRSRSAECWWGSFGPGGRDAEAPSAAWPKVARPRPNLTQREGLGPSFPQWADEQCWTVLLINCLPNFRSICVCFLMNFFIVLISIHLEPTRRLFRIKK